MTIKITNKKSAAGSVLFTCAFLLPACATTSSNTEQKVPVEVVSDPPGARIEANGQYIGTTPLKTEIHRYKNPQTGAWYGLAITAFPTQAGECSQKKVFPENSPMATHMYFDMKLCPYGTTGTHSSR